MMFSRYVFSLLTVATVAAARPLDTDDTGIVPLGQWELEGGIDFARSGNTRLLAFTPVAAYGLTARLQVDFACDYIVEMESGHADVHLVSPALQFKWLAWERAESGTSVGLKGNIGRPHHSSGPRGEHHSSGHFRLLLTQALGPVELDLNAGYDFVGRWGASNDDGYMTSVALRRTVRERLILMGEIVGIHPQRGGAAEGMVAFAVKYTRGDGWHWDALIGTGIGRDAPEIRAVIGFVREL